MTILFDSTTRLQTSATFGLGLVESPTRKPVGPTREEAAYWSGFTLGRDEIPALPSGDLSKAEADNWTAGYTAGLAEAEAERWADYDLHLEREQELSALHDAAPPDDGPSDMPRWAWGGHPGFEE